MTEYVITDRTTGTKYALTVADSQLLYTSTVNATSSEPILEDYTNSGTYWKIFIDNGELSYENTVTVQDDDITLTDSVTGSDYQIRIIDGQMALGLIVVVSKAIYKVAVIRTANIRRVVRSRVSTKIIRTHNLY